MQMQFKAIRVSHGQDWTVVLTTHEGDDHQIGGFTSEIEAQGWIERETGQSILRPC